MNEPVMVERWYAEKRITDPQIIADAQARYEELLAFKRSGGLSSHAQAALVRTPTIFSESTDRRWKNVGVTEFISV